MKTVGRFVVATLACMMSLTAFAQSPRQRDAENLARFQQYASPPQQSLHYFRTDGFQYLGKDAHGDDALALWTGVNQVYLLTLQSPCINLEYAFGIGLSSTSGNVNARMDYVKYDRGRRCRIETIQKVDYKAMRAAGKSAQPIAGGT